MESKRNNTGEYTGRDSQEPFRKARALKDSVVQKASELREKAEPTLLVVDIYIWHWTWKRKDCGDFEGPVKDCRIGNHLNVRWSQRKENSLLLVKNIRSNGGSMAKWWTRRLLILQWRNARYRLER